MPLFDVFVVVCMRKNDERNLSNFIGLSPRSGKLTSMEPAGLYFTIRYDSISPIST